MGKNDLRTKQWLFVLCISDTGAWECLSLRVSPIITIYSLSCKWWGYPGPKSYPTSSLCSQPEKGLSIWLEKHSQGSILNSLWSPFPQPVSLSLDTQGKLNIWNHADKMCKQKLVADIISLRRNIDNSFVALIWTDLEGHKIYFLLKYPFFLYQT